MVNGVGGATVNEWKSWRILRRARGGRSALIAGCPVVGGFLAFARDGVRLVGVAGGRGPRGEPEVAE